jgi:xanthine dehydrogenase YagR molybdenum-binding subunit
MAISWPKQRRLIGTKVPRVDGPDKATGHAKYSYDINRPGMLHAVMLRCPHAHAKIKSLDTAAAEKMPGVRAVHVVAEAGKELFYAGDEVLGLAADTEEHARDAVRAVKIEYEVLPHLVTEEDALKHDGPGTMPRGGRNVNVGNVNANGNVDEAFKTADAVVEGTYGVPVICHQCLESHGLVAEWSADGTGLTVWCSTQAVPITAVQLAQHFKIAAPQVKCITQYMGGGFGCKFGPDVWGTTAAHLAKKAGAPVKLMLDREEEMLAAGQRPSGSAKIKIAGTKDGKITAFEADSFASPGMGGGAGLNLPYVYAIANVKRKHTNIRLNAMQVRAYRAPGHPQSCYLTECAVDDLAAKLGLDPMQVRLKNIPDRLPQAPGNDKHALNVYRDEIAIAARLAEWDKKWHPPGQGGKGPVKHGLGMGLSTWGGAAGKDNQVVVTIASDGSVVAQLSTQDLGTGERTVLPIVVAEVLGLNVKDITVRIGDSAYGASSPSGGSTTCPGTAPPTLAAASAARDALFQKLAGRLKVKAEDLTIEPGQIVDKAGGKKWAWKEACARLGMETVEGRGHWDQALNGAGLSNVGVGGVQIAEVQVDTETGVVRCTHFVAVQDCGLVINKLCCESQVAGGVIMAVNAALFEERIMDRRTGRQVNPDMEFYKLGGIKDIPRITVHMHDMPERGVIGIGEPPTIAGLAAIGNAIHNAIGVRVPHAPFTPERVLEALAKGGKA